jgi:hypothetical protein
VGKQLTNLPIINALSIIDTAIATALTPLAATFNGAAAVYFMQAPPGVGGALAAGTLSKVIVYSLTDNGGKADNRINYAGWMGRVVVHCFSNSKATSNTLLSSVATNLNAMTIVNFDVDVTWIRPTIYPPQNGIWRLSGVWDVWLTRK